MFIVKFTNQYKKSYKLLIKRGLNIKLLDDVVEMLKDGKTLDKRYKDHALEGKYNKFRECHIKPDWLLIYLVEDDVMILTLIDTGSHSDIF